MGFTHDNHCEIQKTAADMNAAGGYLGELISGPEIDTAMKYSMGCGCKVRAGFYSGNGGGIEYWAGLRVKFLDFVREYRAQDQALRLGNAGIVESALESARMGKLIAVDFRNRVRLP